MFKFFLRRKRRRVEYVWGAGNIWTPAAISHWLQHPLIQARIDCKVTAGENGDRFEYFLRHYLQDRLPVERALTLGCGSGELERGLCKYNFALSHDGIDVSDHAIREATEAAHAARLTQIRYKAADLNAMILEPCRYDVVFGVSSIHHVERLEHLFEQVSGALKPGGYFFLDEYVGPTKFQWTDDQLRVINEQLALLPSELRQRISEPGKLKRLVERKTIAYMNEADPSEAVRSAEIVPLLSKFFTILEFKGYGGSLLHELLFDIAGNFSEQNPGSLNHLERLCRVEDELIADGRLAHDFAVIVATL